MQKIMNSLTFAFFVKFFVAVIYDPPKKLSRKKIAVFLNVLCENKVISVFMIFTAISLRNIQIPFSLARIEERRLNFTISITRQTLLHQVLTFALKMGKKGQNCKIICQFYTLTAAW